MLKIIQFLALIIWMSISGLMSTAFNFTTFVQGKRNSDNTYTCTITKRFVFDIFYIKQSITGNLEVGTDFKVMKNKTSIGDFKDVLPEKSASGLGLYSGNGEMISLVPFKSTRSFDGEYNFRESLQDNLNNIKIDEFENVWKVRHPVGYLGNVFIVIGLIILLIFFIRIKYPQFGYYGK